MEIQEFLIKMANIQNALLHFIESEPNETNFQNFVKLVEDNQIQKDRQKFHSFLYLLNKVSNNHNRNTDFISKFEKILNFYASYIKQTFSNTEIFHIFENNKRILLFLINEKIVSIDHHINKSMQEGQLKNANYFDYFQKFNSEEFEDQRKSGVNDDTICNLIQKDLIKEFIIFVNKNNVPLKSKIKHSIFETNSFLNKKDEVTLIEYAAFYGSLQIFNYLRMNEVELTPSLWLCAIHSRNEEMIFILQDYLIEPEYNDYSKCYAEAIKCHHNDIANFIKETKMKESKDISIFSLKQAIKNYNFNFIPKDSINESTFYELVKYDQAFLVQNLLEATSVNLYKTITVF
ncbi:hypothetical protein M9Y10_026009 [Tritrichomonas musculus]|uniref:DUF3447 domain-containing protein n=1 Tax=Tritrichomonas musculus TaxID=1915356 RepID=A0ABR2H8B4_9EUKA